MAEDTAHLPADEGRYPSSGDSVPDTHPSKWFTRCAGSQAYGGAGSVDPSHENGPTSGEALINGLDSRALLACFLEHPPEDFQVLAKQPMPVFSAVFDLLTAADDTSRAKASRLPGYGWWSRWLRPRVAFAGSPVTEYAPLPLGVSAFRLVRKLRREMGHRHAMTVVKDLPHDSPLLSRAANDQADDILQACLNQGFFMVEGLPLAYVPIDFTDVNTYLGRLPKSARRYVQRRLRSRERMTVQRIATGEAFADDALVAAYYALYREVHDNSDIRFDCLTLPFFAALLRNETSGGFVFEYRHAESGDLLGWNLCFEVGGRLVDKYVGLSYPASREMNLYFVSWIVNLEYALERGLSHYVAGVTAGEVKTLLGASFTPTRHAVYVRNPLLRLFMRRFSHWFSMTDQ